MTALQWDFYGQHCIHGGICLCKHRGCAWASLFPDCLAAMVLFISRVRTNFMQLASRTPHNSSVCVLQRCRMQLPGSNYCFVSCPLIDQAIARVRAAFFRCTEYIHAPGWHEGGGGGGGGGGGSECIESCRSRPPNNKYLQCCSCGLQQRCVANVRDPRPA